MVKTGGILERADKLAERADKMSAQNSYAHLEAQPTEIHRRLWKLLLKIFDLIQKNDGSEQVPIQIRTMVRTIRHLEPIIMEGLARAPEEDVRAFIAELVKELQEVTADGAG